MNSGKRTSTGAGKQERRHLCHGRRLLLLSNKKVAAPFAPTQAGYGREYEHHISELPPIIIHCHSPPFSLVVL